MKIYPDDRVKMMINDLHKIVEPKVKRPDYIAVVRDIFKFSYQQGYKAALNDMKAKQEENP